MKDMVEILETPVEDLIAFDAQIRLPMVDVEQWDIAERDRLSLVNLGLPLIDVAEFIPEAEPGTHVRTFGMHTGYYLGILARLDVCLLPETGHVVGVPNDNMGSPAFINSSAYQYVAASWRYYWLHSRLRLVPMTLQTYDDLNAFLAGIIANDPVVGGDPTTSFWPAVVEGW